MRYAVEAKIFNNGKIVARVRPAYDGEESGCTETRNCDIWGLTFLTMNKKHASFAEIIKMHKPPPKRRGEGGEEMEKKDRLYGWRWLFWFAIGLICGFIVLKLTTL